MMYILKHIRRSYVKSSLVVLLAAIQLCSSGQLALVWKSYQQLYMDTAIIARFIGGLPLHAVHGVMDSGYFKDPYYEVNLAADMNGLRTTFTITNDIARYTGEDASIVYAAEYDSLHAMDMASYTIVAGHGLMLSFGLNLGDTVSISPERSLQTINSNYIGYHR